MNEMEKYSIRRPLATDTYRESLSTCICLPMPQMISYNPPTLCKTWNWERSSITYKFSLHTRPMSVILVSIGHGDYLDFSNTKKIMSTLHMKPPVIPKSHVLNRIFFYEHPVSCQYYYTSRHDDISTRTKYSASDPQQSPQWNHHVPYTDINGQCGADWADPQTSEHRLAYGAEMIVESGYMSSSSWIYMEHVDMMV